MMLDENAPDFRSNVAELQIQSFRMLAGLVIAIAYLWLMFLIWPITGVEAPTMAWMGNGILLGSIALGALALVRQHLSAATLLLIWGSAGAIACGVVAYSSLTVAYLFVLPIMCASVLLRQRTVFFVSSAAVVFILFFGAAYGDSLAPDVLLPVAIVALVSVMSWLSAHNLYTALRWFWSGYLEARSNERMAREGEAELRRVLKALDEANYRVKRTNYMLGLAHKQAEEARRLKQQFAQNISHELRTPLNLIVSFTEMMVQSPEYYGSPLPPPYLRDLGIVDRNARHLQSLVNDVLDLARIEAAQMDLTVEEVDPDHLVREAVNTARSLVEARGLALHLAIEPDLPSLWLDPIRIRQVLFNLLSNATRFTDSGSVTVRAQREDDTVLFAVADTGVGIAPDILTTVFEEFQQVDGSTRRRHEGAGLGLAISRRFVELHGGSIWVESQVSQGSTFYFRLPTAQSQAARSAHTYLTGAQQIIASDNDEPILLLITRSLTAASLLTRYIQGCRVVVVPDLERGRKTARQVTPQAVVIDHACRQLDATELEQIGLEWGLPHIPFMVCPIPGEERLRQRLDVDGYLLKPVERESLSNTLRQFGDEIDTILLIDDSQDFARMIQRMLQNSLRRYRVIKAFTARQGIAMLQHHRPDLILLDLTLPDQNGVQVLEQIRANPLWRDLPIVIVSAQDEVDVVEAVAGFMLVTRPSGLVPNDIVQWIQKALSLSVQPWHNGNGFQPVENEAQLVDGGQGQIRLDPLRSR